MNIAARLEALCEPGGICISGTVRDHVHDKIPIVFDDLGEQFVKNIAKPVHAFGLTAHSIAEMPEPATRAAVRVKRNIRVPIALLGMATVVVATAAVWLFVSQGSLGGVTLGTRLPTASNRVAVAVLPFTSLDGNGDYFADGLTEDIISSIGRFRDLSVIARTAVFAYRERFPVLSKSAGSSMSDMSSRVACVAARNA